LINKLEASKENLEACFKLLRTSQEINLEITTIGSKYNTEIVVEQEEEIIKKIIEASSAGHEKHKILKKVMI